ncbi:MAG: ABC transporter ATP-binding protein [Planctomycetota bacterium]|nr:ABC transporter ATP-binding protein [Planctomycetota bacterium]
MRPIISVENLCKAYRVGKKQERADTLVGILRDSMTAPFRNWSSIRQPTSDKDEVGNSDNDLHWALRDVSFEIKEGQILGIIGRNGAGKSTLLKILSRITEPTSGSVRIRGRVSSLLEVGTGFHPELTGRENVYLNGTILGMTKREIDKKFEEIVDFSGVEKFLDTPVKRYSSGMRVRLAFSVAAFLDPEILIIDEVLAVGDAEFQKKCLGRLDSMSTIGRTVLFVSHNIGVLQQLCKTGIYLDRGTMIMQGTIQNAVQLYVSATSNSASFALDNRSSPQDGKIKLVGFDIDCGPMTPKNVLVMGEPARFHCRLARPARGVDISMTIMDDCGQPISNMDSWRRNVNDDLDGVDGDKYVCTIPQLPLRAGRYMLDIQITYQRVVQDEIKGSIFFDVSDGVCYGRTFPYASTPGPVCLDHQWVMLQSGEA